LVVLSHGVECGCDVLNELFLELFGVANQAGVVLELIVFKRGTE
jgi:hypothetical protein